MEPDAYSWGGGSYALFHDSMETQLLPKKIEDYDEKFNMRTYQILLNGISVVFDFDGHIYSFGKTLSDPKEEVEHREPKKIESEKIESRFQVSDVVIAFPERSMSQKRVSFAGDPTVLVLSGMVSWMPI